MADEPPILLSDAQSSMSAGSAVGQYLYGSRILFGGQRDEKLQTATIGSSSGSAAAGSSNQQCPYESYHQPVLSNPALPQYIQPEDHFGPTTDRQDPMTIGDPWLSAADLSATSEREFILVRKTGVVNWESGVVNAVEYECRICCRRFRWRSSISVHIRTHTGRKPYPCRTCQVNFSDSSTRNKHEKKAHNLKLNSRMANNSLRLGEPTAASAGCFERRLQLSRRPIPMCHLCNVSFSSESDLGGHVNQFHNHMVPRFPEALAGQRRLASGGVGAESGNLASGASGSSTRVASAIQRPTLAWLMDGTLQYYQELPQQYQEHIPLPAATAMSVGDACIDVGELMDPATALDLNSDVEVTISGGCCYQSEALRVGAPDIGGYYCADDPVPVHPVDPVQF